VKGCVGVRVDESALNTPQDTQLTDQAPCQSLTFANTCSSLGITRRGHEQRSQGKLE